MESSNLRVVIFGGNAMKITAEKYNKLKDMELINRAKYNLNDRVEMIIQEV